MASIELSVTDFRFLETERVEFKVPRFFAFDGSSRIIVETQSEEDAQYLCREMGWEFICACED
jgi:hypothetical protein